MEFPILQPLIKKISQGIILAFLCLLFTATLNPISAAEEEQPYTTNNNQKIENNKVIWTAYNLSEALAGDPNDPNNNGGAIGYTFNLMGMLYSNPPASTKEYAKSVIQKIQPQSAYATSSDDAFTTLTPLRYLWGKMLSISYFFLTLVMLVIGFMIMLKKKINPQTIATIQNSIPRIIAVLLLVNLSYAIVGFMVDMSTLITNIVIGVIGADVVKGGADAATNLQGANSFSILSIGNGCSSVTNCQPFKIWGAIDNLIKTSFGMSSDTVKNIMDAMGSDFSKIFTNPLGLLVGIQTGTTSTQTTMFKEIIAFILGLLGTVVILVVILTTAFRLFFSLLTSYVAIILSTIFAPIQLIFGALPGQEGLIKSWFKTIIANLLVFPAVFTLLLFAAIFATTPSSPWNIDPGKIGEVTPGWQPILLKDVAGLPINMLIALGILLITPKVPDAIKKALGADGGIAGVVGREVSSRIPLLGGYAKESRP